MPTKRAAAAVVALTAAAWFGTCGLRRSTGATALVQRANRTATVARMGGRTGSSYAMHRARRAFAEAGRREELDTRFELKTAEQIAATLGNMKGAMMKLGQMASYLDSGMPPHVREALAQLQADAPPMSAELAADVVDEIRTRVLEEVDYQLEADNQRLFAEAYRGHPRSTCPRSSASCPPRGS